MSGEQREELVFIPFGGVGEIGMNMAAYGFGPENNRKWLVVDCGVSFAGPELPGIELILADPAFLEEEANNVLALVLTHSHEDHYGAVLDIWPDFDKPVYATPFAAAMLAAKRASNGITDNVEVHIMIPGGKLEIGPFTVEPVSMAHSIPESCALLIETALGQVLHTGDWKIDLNPIAGAPIDAERLKQIGTSEAPLALVCDSTNALKEGNSPSEQEVGAELEKIISEAPSRVAITTFASNVGRIIAIARAAANAGREVVLAGRALHRVVTIARELGLMEGVKPFHDQDAYAHLPRSKVVLLCTGSQGEARAAVARISLDEHPAIELDAGDIMVFSSWAIPGNEKAVIDIQNRFIERGVKVITNADRLVHVTGHPRRNELVQLYDWVKPDTLVPVHGEPMHLAAHAQLGRDKGIKTVLEVRNGDMARLFPKPENYPGEVGANELYLDADILCTPEESGVKGRRRLSFGGLVVVSLCINGRGDIASGPEYVIEGLPVLEDEEDLELMVGRILKGTMRSLPSKRRTNAEYVAESIRRAVRAELNSWWGRKPNVSVFVHKV